MDEFKSELQALTDEQIQKAFEAARDEANITEGKLVRITKEYYQKAKDFIQEYFIPQEPLEKAFGVQWNDEIDEFWQSFYDWNISLMLLDENDEVMAIRTTRFAMANESHDYDKDVKTESWRHVLKFVDQGEAKSKYFYHFKAKECVHFFGLGTNNKYRNMHLASKLLNASVLMIKNFGIRPVYIKGEGSNIYSKAVYEHNKHGFELLHDEPFENYVVDGQKLIQNTGDNKSLRFYGLSVLS
ncbi:hypothetical protein ACF0H5_020384 [Mactra antiquata]